MFVKVCSKAPVAAALLVALYSCAGTDGGDEVAIRLVDRFDADRLEGAQAAVDVEPQALWDFASSAPDAPLLGWRAGQDVVGLRVEAGRLVGRTTGSAPVLFVEAPKTIDLADGLHSIEVVLEVDQGEEARVSHSAPEPKFTERVDPTDWDMHADLEPGDQAKSLKFRNVRPSTMRQAQWIAVSPTNVAGASFAVASVRVVSQREHRAASPSGVGWQGLGGVYHETIVSRAEERFAIDVDLRADSFLDLSAGTVESAPVTFRVDAVDGSEQHEILRRTVTTPHRWEHVPIELDGHRGVVSLRFSVLSEQDSAIGFWGSPVVRRRGVAPSTNAAAGKALGGTQPPQGVIVFLADTLRNDHLPFHGYNRDTAPHLTALAGEGAVFLDAIAQASWTKVSVPSILTSLYPTSHRIRVIPDRISALAKTLAEVYRDAGYATASFPSNSFAGMMTNLHQGFEESHEAAAFNRDDYGPKTAREVVDHAIEWIERKQDVPFFAYVHVVDPHSPFEPREPYTYRWADREQRERHDADWKKLDEVIQSDFRKRQRVALPSELEASGIDVDRWLEYEKDWYDASIVGMDSEVRRILERLDTLGIADRVAFAFVSDHGEEFLEHGHMFHGQSAYGDLSNVPMVLWYPGAIPPGARIEETVRSIDLMPTLLDLSGLETPAEAQGQSLLPLIAAASNGDDAEELGWMREVIVTEKAAEDNTDDPTDLANALEAYAIISGEWKLVRNVAGHEALGRPEFELYRHKQDPLDLENVADQHLDVVERLTAELETWKNMATQAQLPKAEEGVGDDVPPDQLEQLRNLGYIN